MRKLLIAALLSSPVAVHAVPLGEAGSAQIIAAVDQRAPAIQSAALDIWRFAEVGYQESKSSALLQKQLKDAGFEVKANVAGMPTAFVATFSNGKGPVVGMLAEFDALPGLSQAAEPGRKPVTAGGAGHGCGHNLFGAASVGAAIAIKSWMQANKVAGELRLYGTPAEEGGGAKVYMSRAGLFDDVGAVIHWHPDDTNSAAQDFAMANISGKFRFRGVAAHAAGSPDKGRSALDALEIMDVAVQFMREHIPDGVRIHNIVTNGGSAPNVVPDFAESYYYVRHKDPEVVREVLARVRKVADGIAIATETQVEFELMNGVFALLPNDTLGRLMDTNLRKAGTPAWTAQETAFARELSKTLGDGAKPLENASKIPAYSSGGPGGGSTDVGDVSWVVPTVGLNVATYVPGTPAHSWQAVAAAGTGIGTKGAVVAAKAMALTGAELFSNPEIIAAARAEFDERRGKGFKYKPLIGDRSPPLDYRK
ncbi:amidohydrolase [Sphingoaurantiacus capsulatus]|uniref:Amidohydrolase n=1 Tax=Sphingoaurantiacus capsulatus TaxID=1771310 RepID=A0ABV7XE20_9SPHN